MSNQNRVIEMSAESTPATTGSALQDGTDPFAASLSEWYASLGDCERTIVAWHLCVDRPVPLAELARAYRMTTAQAQRHAEGLPQKFQDAVEASASTLGRAVLLFETATAIPVTRRDLSEWHPWLNQPVTETGVTALALLLGVHWTGDSQGDWLLDGDLESSEVRTRQVLALEPGELIATTTASALLAAAGARVPATDEWLMWCGFSVEAGQVGLDDPAGLDIPIVDEVDPAAIRMWAKANGVEGVGARGRIPTAIVKAYKGARQKTEPTVEPSSAGGVSNETATAVESAQSSTTNYPSEFNAALAELGAHAWIFNSGMTLGALLGALEHLPPPVRDLAARILRATPSHTGWALPAEEKAEDRTHYQYDDESEPTEEASLEDQVVAVLRDAGEPMKTSQLQQRIPELSDLRELRSILFSDNRIAMSDAGGWTLTDEEFARTAKRSILETPTPAASRGTPTVRRTPQPQPLPKQSAHVEQAWDLLSDRNHPLTTTAIAEVLGLGSNVRNLRSQLGTDTRFVRSDADAWSLAEWKMRPYTTLKGLAAEEVEKAGGSISLDALIAKLTRDFTIKEASLRATVTTAPFITRDGVVRWLTHESDALQGRSPQVLGSDDRPGDGPSTDDLINLMGLS